MSEHKLDASAHDRQDEGDVVSEWAEKKRGDPAKKIISKTIRLGKEKGKGRGVVKLRYRPPHLLQ